ncbi:MAG TPA: glycosyltransferase [Anaerolineae bacterium]
MMRVLFITPYIPSLIRVRPYNLLRTLCASGHQIHLVALQPPEDREASLADLRELCERVDVFPLTRGRTLWNATLALPTTLPLQAAYSHHPEAERHLYRLVESGRFDVVHVEHLRGAVLAQRLRGIPRVFDSVDSITYLFEQASRFAPRFRQRLIARLDLGRTRHFEARAPLSFDRTLVTSPTDAHALRMLIGDRSDGRIVVLPNGVDLDYFHPTSTTPDPATILFSGKMSYHANSAAALFLAHEIMPRVWQRHPEARLVIAGKGPSPAVRDLGVDSRITVTGYVDDLRPHFARATIALSPLLYGAGIQNKVLEAMSSGVPVIATPQVCSALRAQPGRDMLIGDAAEQLAAHTLSLIDDPERRNRIGASGRLYVERFHSWPEIVRSLTTVYEEACAMSPATRVRP